ncbi:MAG: ATP-binding cassette domain-containing protein [Lachnospiraceae bacterium]|nr:ATP-binding cassette domain-containing protein [Lachnospiraceae bacterium]
MAFIEIDHLEKTFTSKSGDTEALKDISFSIDKGEIFGVIGLSGAGKSTLVRCINLLEKPSGGRVIIDGKDMLALSERELKIVRRDIGMIFQHFNLLMQRTVLDNVCFPMEIAGVKKKEARVKALTYLEQVGLAEKAAAYPAQLSGGQKQRVAIARVLASKPRILLCDEATSALDPQTTQSILQLLKQINEKYSITMVVITHEMRVVEQICDRVAVLEYGKIVESGRTKDVFESPKTEAARRLIYTRDYNDIMSGGSGI